MPTATAVPSPPRRPEKSGWRPALAVAALLIGYTVMALSASRVKSVAFDELPHLAAGYAYWEKGDFRLQPENGNFPQRWATLPFLFSKPTLPPKTDSAWTQPDVWGLGAALLNRRVNDPDQLLLQARAMIALLGTATALVVFLWARNLFGDGAGFVALTLAVFCPALLAHGSLVTSDMAFACLLLIATWSVWQLLHEFTALRLLLSLLAGAVLFLAKMSAPLFFPLVFGLIVVRVWRGQPWRYRLGNEGEWKGRKKIVAVAATLGAVHVVFGWVAIWAAYDFRYAPTSAAVEATPFAVNFTGDAGLTVRCIQALDVAQVLPKAYLYGYEFVLRASAYRYAFFNGEHGFGGWAWFFPYAFLVKTPLAFFPLGAFALWGIASRCSAAVKDRLYALTPVLVLLLVFGVAAVTAHLNIGHRHLLPLLPALYILTGAAWPPAFGRGEKWRRGTVLVLVTAFAVESWAIRPHYLAFFNRLAGGPDQAWRHLVDSSLDWGMDLPSLRDWLQKNRRDKEPVHFGYFGMGTPDDYGIDAVSLTTYYGAESRRISPLRPGLYVVSATLLQVYPPAFGPWNKNYEASYQQTAANLSVLYEATPEARSRLVTAKGEAYWTDLHRHFNDLRFARLCAWLRPRAPMAQVAHTLLVWRLTAEDLRDAQFGPPAELAEAPVAIPAKAR